MCIHSRNLSFNDLRTWKVNPTNELQGMKKLDVTGNEHWLPRAQILQLSNLTTVEGVSLSQYCPSCSLCKMTSDDANSSFSRGRWLGSSPSHWRWPDEIQYGRALDFVKLGFWPTCLADLVCLIDQYTLPGATSIYDVTIKSSFALYATGSAALLVNLTVVVFIVLHKSLRNDLAVRLLLNVAVCDAVIALTTILYKRFHVFELHTEFLLDQLQGKQREFNAFRSEWTKLFNITGVFLTCAVASQVFGSAIAMLDKFLKIVFAMKPEVRLGSKAAALSLCSSWSLSAIFAVLPVFGIGGMTYFTDLVYISPLPFDDSTFEDGRLKQPFGFAAGSLIALVLLQLASFLLYVPIFVVAKKSGANVGVKREAAIARKIALLLCTNLIFFTVPVVTSIFRSAALMELNNNLNDDWRSFTLAQVQRYDFIFDFLPVLCLSINSLLNPFLYALRHQKIKQQLNPLLSHCLAATRECFGILRQKSRCSTANVEATNNEVEMLEGRIPEHGSLAQEGNCKEENQPIPPQPPSHAGGINKVESEDTRDSPQQHA